MYKCILRGGSPKIERQPDIGGYNNQSMTERNWDVAVEENSNYIGKWP